MLPTTLNCGLRIADCGLARPASRSSCQSTFSASPSTRSTLPNPQSAIYGEPSVLLYRDHLGDPGRERRRQAPPPRPDLEHDVARRGVERGDEPHENVR